ncbi:MAG: DNA translocase FtsK [Pseudomonadota bacterium]
MRRRGAPAVEPREAPAPGGLAHTVLAGVNAARAGAGRAIEGVRAYAARRRREREAAAGRVPVRLPRFSEWSETLPTPPAPPLAVPPAPETLRARHDGRVPAYDPMQDPQALEGLAAARSVDPVLGGGAPPVAPELAAELAAPRRRGAAALRSSETPVAGAPAAGTHADAPTSGSEAAERRPDEMAEAAARPARLRAGNLRAPRVAPPGPDGADARPAAGAAEGARRTGPMSEEERDRTLAAAIRSLRSFGGMAPAEDAHAPAKPLSRPPSGPAARADDADDADDAGAPPFRPFGGADEGQAPRLAPSPSQSASQSASQGLNPGLPASAGLGAEGEGPDRGEGDDGLDPAFLAQAEHDPAAAVIAGLARAAERRQQRSAAPKRSRRAEQEAQPSLFDAAGAGGEGEPYEAPALGLLQRPVEIARPQASNSALEENARMLETVLEDYGVRGEITAVKPGPVVTLYELEPAPGLKASRVIGLADDIARSMSALSARIATVPGRSVIGIELPNTEREKVWLRETLESRAYGDARFPLALALGKDIEGAPVIANLAKMPHLLIAGTTGSGKSVAINTMILSLLYRLSPEQCRLIMIDPKMLELSVYDNIPHLLAPVVTDPKKAVVALKWVVAEMEERYRKMSKLGVRNIDGYNARCRDAKAKGEGFTRTIQTGFDEVTGEPTYETQEFEPEEMPLIVVIVDEMADLMMVAGKEIEACIQRLAQMARASGIHLIMATQRPSVDVITGTIKANFPTRISFQVTSKIDSRTILGEQGAEQLLGMGDMLYMSGGGRIRRVHGPFVSDEEVEEVVRHLKSLGQPSYVSAVTEGGDEETQTLVDEKLGLAAAGDGDDALYDKAVAIVARDRKCSTSYIQRKLAIGYNKAARLVEMMEDQGVVTPANAVGKREILVEER